MEQLEDKLGAILNNPQLNELIDSACLAAKDLNEFIKPFLKLIYSYTHKKKSFQDSMIPYADFTVDLPPVIHTVDAEHFRD